MMLKNNGKLKIRVKNKIDNGISSIRKWTKRLLGISLILSLTYLWGTFYPNKYTQHINEKEYELKYLEKLKELDLREPAFEYNNKMQFVRAVHKCVDYLNFTTADEYRVPYEMVTAQAVLESAWGNSRFAKEGNNLFGIRVFETTQPHMLPEGMSNWPGWGVRIFATKCDSIKEYIRLMNEHPAYEKFRKLRIKQIKLKGQMEPIALVKTLDKFSTTPDYPERVIRILHKIRKLEEQM